VRNAQLVFGPLFLSLNIKIRSSPVCSIKNGSVGKLTKHTNPS